MLFDVEMSLLFVIVNFIRAMIVFFLRHASRSIDSFLIGDLFEKSIKKH